jgi:hypothetical protein
MRQVTCQGPNDFPAWMRYTSSPWSYGAPENAAVDPGVPVNTAIRTVNPLKKYPVHFDLLMRDLVQRGAVREHWQVVMAEEVRLDETDMDQAFTLVDDRTKAVLRRRVDVQNGCVDGTYLSSSLQPYERRAPMLLRLDYRQLSTSQRR